MLIAAVLIYAIIIFPFFIKVKAKYEEKAVFISLKFFGFIPIFNCILTFQDVGIEIRRKYKSKTIKYFSLLPKRKKWKPFLDLNITSIRLTVKKGSDDIFYPVVFAVTMQVLSEISGKIISVNKPYLKFFYESEIYLGEKFTEIILKTNILLNNLTVLINLIKYITGKILNERKRKQSKSGDRKFS